MRVPFICPKCGCKVKYNVSNLSKYSPDGERLTCKNKECKYLLTKDETCKVLSQLMAKKI